LTEMRQVSHLSYGSCQCALCANGRFQHTLVDEAVLLLCILSLLSLASYCRLRAYTPLEAVLYACPFGSSQSVPFGSSQSVPFWVFSIGAFEIMGAEKSKKKFQKIKKILKVGRRSSVLLRYSRSVG